MYWVINGCCDSVWLFRQMIAQSRRNRKVSHESQSRRVGILEFGSSPYNNSPSSYISATEIPEDTMEDDSNRLSAMERELGSQHQSLNDIRNQLIMLIALSGGVNPGVEAPPAVTNVVVAPLNPLNTTTHQLKPVTPSEFTGDCTKRRAFLNSCNLYIGLSPTQFTNDQARIYWVLSFMKGNCAVCFTNWTMWLAQQMGSLPWVMWAEFRLEFICDFCPKNEVQTARTDLETSKYHQCSHSVNEYVNEFCELVDCAEYTKGANIVLTFWHGLSPIIQNYIACLTYGQPSDDIPKDWYDAAILCDENHIANSAFQSTLQSTRTTANTGVGANHNPVAGLPNLCTLLQPSDNMTPSIGFASRPPWDPNAMDVNATWRQGPNMVVCYQCGKTSHTRPNCPEAFNVCTMTVEECTDSSSVSSQHWMFIPQTQINWKRWRKLHKERPL